MSSDASVQAGIEVSGTVVVLGDELYPALRFSQAGKMLLVVGEPYLQELPDLLTGAIADARARAKDAET